METAGVEEVVIKINKLVFGKGLLIEKLFYFLQNIGKNDGGELANGRHISGRKLNYLYLSNPYR